MTRRQALYTLCNLFKYGHDVVRYGDLSVDTETDQAIFDVLSMCDEAWNGGSIYAYSFDEKGWVPVEPDNDFDLS